MSTNEEIIEILFEKLDYLSELSEEEYKQRLNRELRKFSSLLQNLKNIDYQNKDKNTLLKQAVIYELYEFVELLLSKGANASFNHDVKKSLLVKIAHFKTTEMAELLLSYGMNPNLTDDIGYTLLLYASRIERLFDLVKLLLSANADPNILSNDSTPLSNAVGYGLTKHVEILLEHGAIQNFPQGRPSLMLISYKNGHSDITNLLLKFGANPNATYGDKKTLLHVASMKEDTELMKNLIKHEADVNLRDNKRETPLYYTNKPNNILLLLKNGAYPTIININGESILLQAVLDNNLTKVQLLLLYRSKITFDVDITERNMWERHGRNLRNLSSEELKQISPEDLKQIRLNNSKVSRIFSVLRNFYGNASLINLTIKTLKDNKFSIDNLPENFCRFKFI